MKTIFIGILLIILILSIFIFLKKVLFWIKYPKYRLVKKILGKDFISPEEIMRSRKGIIYSNEQLSKLSETLPTQEILEWCRDNNYMLVSGPNCPMSLIDIRNLKNSYFYSKGIEWYDDREFVQNDKVEFKWYMIRKNILLNNNDLPKSIIEYCDYHQLFSKVETVPNVAEFVWVITTYRRVSRICLFVTNHAIVSNSELYPAIFITVGFYGSHLVVDYIYDSQCHKNVGLSVARK